MNEHSLEDKLWMLQGFLGSSFDEWQKHGQDWIIDVFDPDFNLYTPPYMDKEIAYPEGNNFYICLRMSIKEENPEQRYRNSLQELKNMLEYAGFTDVDKMVEQPIRLYAEDYEPYTLLGVMLCKCY